MKNILEKYVMVPLQLKHHQIKLILLSLVDSIGILFEIRTGCILMQLGKIKFLMIGKELKQP
ncbi:hypothetical protein, partial [Nostoc sp.]|uniref:hypothetical protein n=1 Tax=Nostoc sp. TaxID=1180 RepID=UPI002FF8DEAC